MPNSVTIPNTLTSNDLISGKRAVIIFVEDPSGFTREVTVLGTPIDVDLEIEGVHHCNAKAVLLTHEQALDLGTILLTPVVPALNHKAEPGTVH